MEKEDARVMCIDRFSGTSRLFLPAQKVKLILRRNFSALWRSPGSFSELG